MMMVDSMKKRSFLSSTVASSRLEIRGHELCQLFPRRPHMFSLTGSGVHVTLIHEGLDVRLQRGV
jgi:hypothetical protein